MVGETNFDITTVSERVLHCCHAQAKWLCLNNSNKAPTSFKYMTDMYPLRFQQNIQVSSILPNINMIAHCNN